MLSVKALNVFYGESHVLHDVTFELEAGKSLAIMGRNGMGKSTLLKALIGMVPVRSGSVRMDGREISKARSHERVRAGIGFVPQGRLIFPYLTVEENILTGMENSGEARIPAFIFHAFPVLFETRKRFGGNLSGGQQQQLAIARALVSNPKVLILDEPTDGIQPSIIREIAVVLNRLKRERAFSVVLSEQVMSFAIDVADEFLVIEKGSFVHRQANSGPTGLQTIQKYLSV